MIPAGRPTLTPMNPTQRSNAAASLSGVLCAALLLLLPACVADNSRVTTGPGTLLPIFASTPAADATKRPADPPSAATLSRDSWATIDVVVNPDALITRPTYATDATIPRNTARQRGDPPTPRSALESSRTSDGTFYREAFLSPIDALGDLVMMPWHMYQHSPWAGKVTNPIRSYWRTPTPDASLETSPSRRLFIESSSQEPSPTPPQTKVPPQ